MIPVFVVPTRSLPLTRVFTMHPADMRVNTLQSVWRVNKHTPTLSTRSSVKGFSLIINFADAVSVFIFCLCTLVPSTNCYVKI